VCAVLAGRCVGVTLTGETREAGVEEAGEGVARRGGFGIAGAWTTLRPGAGPSAIPRGADGDARSRGIKAPPPTATASRSAAITLSLWLMLAPPPADTISHRDYRQQGGFA
jgi:hypothetical protein